MRYTTTVSLRLQTETPFKQPCKTFMFTFNYRWQGKRMELNLARSAWEALVNIRSLIVHVDVDDDKVNF